MAYASASAVAALTKNLVGGQPTFTDTSCPTQTEVNACFIIGNHTTPAA